MAFLAMRCQRKLELPKRRWRWPRTQRGTELNFRDSWKYNVADYEVAKILGLNMLPSYVERKVGGKTGSLSWWVDDAMMEVDRFKKKMEPPDMGSWNKQMYAVRVFHELIYDTDPNLTNILISKDWQIWIIDCSRAFRVNKTIREPKNLVQCDRKLLAKLRTLDKGVLRDRVSSWLTNAEIDGVVSRAAKIVQLFDKEVTAKGESSVLYDFPRSEQACGTGLYRITPGLSATKANLWQEVGGFGESFAPDREPVAAGGTGSRPEWQRGNETATASGRR